MTQATQAMWRDDWREVASYHYQNLAGQTVFSHVRWQARRPHKGRWEKTFRYRWVSPHPRPCECHGDLLPDWQWPLKLNGDGVELERLPFHLPQIRAAASCPRVGLSAGAPLFITEGEKDALAIEQLGCVATSSAFGATNWGVEESRWLVEGGWRDGIVVVIDDDDKGWEHGYVTLRALATVAVESDEIGPDDWPTMVVRAAAGKEAACNDAHDAIVREGLGWLAEGPWWQPVSHAEVLRRWGELTRKAAQATPGVEGLTGSKADWHAKAKTWNQLNLKAALQKGDEW